MSEIKIDGASYTVDEVNALKELIATSSVPLFALEQSYFKTDFGFNLGRKTGGADFLVTIDHRYLIYESTYAQELSRAKLVQAKIPHIQSVSSVIARRVNYQICPVPLAAQPLDNRVYKEQGPVNDYLGAFEILAKTAELLSRLYVKTHQLPRVLALNRLALTTGQNQYIKLVPPVDLIEVAEPTRLVKDILERELNIQDPFNLHQRQLDYFESEFARGLRWED